MSIKDAHNSWVTAYESIRPTGEVDSRAKLVLVSALVLIALCLVTEKPDSINVLGFTFKPREWLVLGIPLLVVVLYSTVQLYLAWSVQRSKTEHAIFAPILSIRTWIQTMMTAQIENGRKFIDEIFEMSRRRAEIQEWYTAQSDAVLQQNTSDLKQAGAIESEEISERLKRRWDDLQTEYEKRRSDSGLTDHEKKVDSIYVAVLTNSRKRRLNPAASSQKGACPVLGR